MSAVATQAARITPSALDHLNGVLQISFSPWADELQAGLKRHSGQVAVAAAAVEDRLRALRRRTSEYAWGASIFIAQAAVVAECSHELPSETRNALGRPWAELLAR